MTKLEFRARPPAEFNAHVSQTVAIDCTASEAPRFPLVYTQWVLPSSPLCGAASEQPNVLPNGTLLISQTTGTSAYTCKAHTLEEAISTTVRVYVPPSRAYAYCVY